METSQEKALPELKSPIPIPRTLRRNLDSTLRNALAEYYRSGRRKDRDHAKPDTSWLSQGRGLREYCYELDIPAKHLYQEIQQQLSKGKVQVLDIGVGQGKFLQDLAFQFEDRLELEGLALTRQVPSTLQNYRHRIGTIESYRLPYYRSHFIFSVRGGLIYSIDQFSALQNLLNGLKKGGAAYLECPKFLLNQEWFQNCLRKVGFEIKILKKKENQARAFCLQRQEEKLLDLSEFSKTFIRLLNEHKAYFLEHGFDRTYQSKVLDPKFTEIYAQSHYIGLEPALKE